MDLPVKTTATAALRVRGARGPLCADSRLCHFVNNGVAVGDTANAAAQPGRTGLIGTGLIGICRSQVRHGVFDTHVFFMETIELQGVRTSDRAHRQGRAQPAELYLIGGKITERDPGRRPDHV